MRVLVTGATGLIGTEVIRQLKARGDEVVTMVRRAPRNETEREWQPDRGYLQAGTLDGVGRRSTTGSPAARPSAAHTQAPASAYPSRNTTKTPAPSIEARPIATAPARPTV